MGYNPGSFLKNWKFTALINIKSIYQNHLAHPIKQKIQLT